MAKINYQKGIWRNNQTPITPTSLNHMEAGIKAACDLLDDGGGSSGGLNVLKVDATTVLSTTDVQTLLSAVVGERVTTPTKLEFTTALTSIADVDAIDLYYTMSESGTSTTMTIRFLRQHSIVVTASNTTIRIRDAFIASFFYQNACEGNEFTMIPIDAVIDNEVGEDGTTVATNLIFKSPQDQLFEHNVKYTEPNGRETITFNYKYTDCYNTALTSDVFQSNLRTSMNGGIPVVGISILEDANVCYYGFISSEFGTEVCFVVNGATKAVSMIVLPSTVTRTFVSDTVTPIVRMSQ